MFDYRVQSTEYRIITCMDKRVLKYFRLKGVREVYRSTLGIQKYSRHNHSKHKDVLQSYRSTPGIEKYSSYTKVLQVYRSTSGIQKYFRHTEVL